MVYFFLLQTSLSSQAYAQTNTLEEGLDRISRKFDLPIKYKKRWFTGFQYSKSTNELSFSESLRKILKNTGFAFIEHNESIYIIESISVSTDLAHLIKLNSTSEEYTRENYIKGYNELSIHWITGKISDGKTDEPLINITIVDNVTGKGTTSSSKGTYNIQLPIGKHSITYSGVGFEKVVQEVDLYTDITNNVQLFEESLLMNEIVISGSSIAEVVESSQTGMEIMKIDAIKKIPAFMGEVDIVKSITSLPGVSSVGEGASGFNVRGGNADQNLILTDGIPIFNSSHLFGFFSIFNPDIVNSYTLYKGGIPVKYGGRASSVLEVNTRNGSLNDYKLSGNIGLISNKLNLEGPIKREKSSFILAVRAANPTWMFRYVPNDEIKSSHASFNDFNLKLFNKINDDVKISSSSYYSSDKFKFEQDTTFKWNAFGSSLKLEGIVNKLAWNITGSYSNYQNFIEGNAFNVEYNYSTFISAVGFKSDFNYYLNDKDVVEFGIESNYYDSNNGNIESTNETSSINDKIVENDKALETSAFLSVTKEFGGLTVTAGTRFSYYANVGFGTEYLYSNSEFPTERSLIDSINHRSGSFFGESSGWEPRLNVKFQINSNSSVKLGYNRLRQYMQMVSKSVSIAPNDYWKLSDGYIKPLVIDQVSFGYYRIFRMYSISTEVYYKQLQDLIEYRKGENTFLTDKLEVATVNAQGKSYGLETKIEKRGRLSGWLSYTFSRTLKKLNENNGYESGFKNVFFPAEFDKPHNLNVNLNYDLTKRMSVSANFVYTSGRPVTAPTGAYYLNDQLIMDYSEKNNTRIPSYHRLDIALNLDTNLKKNKRFEGNWSFSVYNVYGRKNPFSIYFDTSSKGRYPKAYQLSILGNAFPSISYNFRIK